MRGVVGQVGTKYVAIELSGWRPCPVRADFVEIELSLGETRRRWCVPVSGCSSIEVPQHARGRIHLGSAGLVGELVWSHGAIPIALHSLIGLIDARGFVLEADPGLFA